MTLGAMAALALGILAYWTLGRARARLERDAVPLPGETSERITEEETDSIKRKVLRYRERDRAAAAAPARGEDGEAAEADEPSGDEGAVRPIPDGDRVWLEKEMRGEEAARAKFLPQLDDFRPLEYDAVRGFRALMQDRVPGGFAPKLAPPGGGADLTVVDAGPEGLVLEDAGGGKKKVPWDDVPLADAYRIAREMTPPGSPEARDRDLLYLAQLATLAGKADDASSHRARAAVLHFRAALGEEAPDEAKALYAAALALVEKRTARGWESESDRDELALDMLHLSRLAASAGKATEAAAYSAKALELDPLLEDEAAGRASRDLDRWLLENESWAWDPDDTSKADVRTANDLDGDARAILHVYRYMRTLGPRRLEKAAFAEASYARLLDFPRQTRGRVYTAECGLIRPYRTMRFTRRAEHLDAGVQEVEFLYLSAKDSPGGIYLVCVPRATRFRQGDFLRVTGVYLRRWPYQKPNGRWSWIPWIVASKIEKIELAGAKGWGAFIYALLGLGAVGAVVLFFAARREWRDVMASRDHLHARRRGGRDLIRRKVAGALPSSGAGAKPPADGDGKPAAEGTAPPKPEDPPPGAGAGEPPADGGGKKD